MALPAYQDYIVRSRITEGLGLAESAKVMIGSDAASQADLDRISSLWNAQSTNTGASSKFVDRICMSAAGAGAVCPAVAAAGGTGVLTIAYNAVNVGGMAAAANLLQLHPYVRTGVAVAATPTLVASMAAGTAGSLDWACVSATNTTAAAPTRFGAAAPPVVAAGIVARFVPSECR